MRPRLPRIRPGTTFTSIGRIASRPSRPLWLRVALGLLLSVGAFSLVGPPSVLGEGSANLEANGGKRALTEWRTSLYGNLLPRRTLFKVYAKAGEEIALGSSGVGVGSGDIVVWTPGQITSPLTVALPPPAFTCSTSQPGAGALTTRAQEVAGPLPAAGGYTPCIYTPATTGVYNVAFYGPAGGQSDGDGSAGTIAAPVIDATQASGVSMWDITVRPVADPSAPISGRVFTDYLAQITGGNGATYRVESTLWAVTSDGFEYQIDLRGLDPNGFILYGNTVGFLNPDGVTPLYHDLVADVNPLTNIEGGVELSPPTGLLFFAPPAGDLPSSIVPTPVVPTVNSITFQGTAGAVSGVPGSGLQHRRQHRVRRQHRRRRRRGHRAQPGRERRVRQRHLRPHAARIDRWSASWRPASRTSPGTARTTAAPPCRRRGRGMAARATASVPPCTRASTTSRCSMRRTACSAGRPSRCSTRPAAPARLRVAAPRSSTTGATRRPAAPRSAPSARSCPATTHPRRPDFSDTGFDTTSTTIRAYGDNSSQRLRQPEGPGSLDVLPEPGRRRAAVHRSPGRVGPFDHEDARGRLHGRRARRLHAERPERGQRDSSRA